MDLNSIREYAYKLMYKNNAHPDQEKGFIFYHGERVGKLAVNLRKEIFPEKEYDDNVIMAASYFHDIAKGIEPHGMHGAILTNNLLKDYCGKDELQKVVDIIRFHQLRGKDNNYPYYVKLVQDADFIDHYGSIGIGLGFCSANYYNKNMLELLEDFNEELTVNSARKADLLNYDVSKKIYKSKVDFTRVFVKRFSVELEGNIYPGDF